MIIVCEPTIKYASHEKVNSGFIHGLTLAYPNEKIKVYAHVTHIKALQHISKIDCLDFSAVEFTEINFSNPEGFIQFFKYYFLLKKLYRDAFNAKEARIFFLSFSPSILFLLKKMKLRHAYRKMQAVFVLHGSFESVSTDLVSSLPVAPIPTISKSLSDRFRDKNIPFIVAKILQKLFQRFIEKLPNFWTKFKLKFFVEKKLLLQNVSKDFRYITLSPHALLNAEKYITEGYKNYYSVVLPTVFKNFPMHISSDHVRFAVFGYGNSTMLYNVLLALSKKKIIQPYEIKIISMDNRGTDGFKNIINTSPGVVLDRKDMEEYAKDVDIFLNLYDKTRYRLTCSGSILEALSYSKPVLHFDNDCLNFFNQENEPIGFRCHSIDEYAEQMADIVENFPKYRKILEKFGDNIATLRARYSIEKSAPAIRAALEGS